MYAILNENLALRSWEKLPNGVVDKRSTKIYPVPIETIFRLMDADGTVEMPDDELQRELIAKGWIKECGYKEYSLTDWQKFREYSNRAMVAINLQITGKCNYNCIHCFNAKDNAPLNAELSLPEIENILDQAVDCGIYGVLLTGGEPMLHRDFDKILDAVYNRGMHVFAINTNGFFFKQSLFDHLKKLKADPILKVSFDGTGFHDWMRGVKGAEERTVEAIRMALTNGFHVLAQVNLNRTNQECIPDTLDMLDRLGVEKTRLIRTSESPRWRFNGGESIPISDYYDTVNEILREYIQKPHKMVVHVWEYVEIIPKDRSFNFHPLMHVSKNYLKQPVCLGIRGMAGINAKGDVYPCLQISGELIRKGIYLGNVFTDGLKKLLTKSNYLDCITMTVEDCIEHNTECRNCEYLRYCGCGCPALTLTNPVYEGDLKGHDVWKCMFFKQHYDKKCEKAFAGYKNTTPIEIEEKVNENKQI